MRSAAESVTIPFLTYHEIDVPGRELSREFKGHLAYAVPEDQVRSEISFLRDNGWRIVTVGDALSANGSPGRRVAITFDDGSETDVHTAAPLLQDAGFRATFYLIAGWLGRPRYLSPRQARELHASGFEIGCHSMSHQYLTCLNDRELCVEVIDSKARLEEALGAAVHHFSCPGGFWNRKLARLAKESGYRSVATSRIGCNTPASDPYRLSRICILRGMHIEDFRSICLGNELFLKQARERISAIPKTVLGANLYLRLHAALHSHESKESGA